MRWNLSCEFRRADFEEWKSLGRVCVLISFAFSVRNANSKFGVYLDFDYVRLGDAISTTLVWLVRISSYEFVVRMSKNDVRFTLTHHRHFEYALL